MQRKKHSREEIATKLSKADELHERGKTQAEIARTLGVSAMTYHRWRKEIRTITNLDLSTNPSRVATTSSPHVSAVSIALPSAMPLIVIAR
jgi:transposase-like protein